MYNSHQHRGMAPPGPPAADGRLNELLDQVRAEFNTQAGRTGEYEQQMNAHMHDMDIVRRQIYDLERRHHEMKTRYEEENSHLRRELEARGGAPGPHSHPPPQPPNIGQGQNHLFGPIMSGAHGSGGGVPGLAPPPPPGLPQDQRPGAAPAPSAAPQGPPGHFGPYPGANGYPQQPQPQGSPGGKPGVRRPPGGPATPQQTQIALQPGIPDVGNHLADLDPETIPASHKREGQDWFAIYNPRAPRRLEVDLMHNLSHNSVVCCVRFSHDGMYIATGCNRSAQIFEVETGTQVAHLQDQGLPADGDLYIRSVCFSPDGRYLATGAEDKIIRVWDIREKTIRNQFSGHEQDIYSLDFARNGRIIASGSGDRSVRLWDLEANAQVLSLSIEDGVTTVAISPDNNYVAAGSLDKSVRVWDIRTGFLVERLEGERGHRDSVYSVAFSPNGRDLVSGSLDKTIKLWELSNTAPRMNERPSGGKCIRTFEGHKDFVLSVALTPDAQWVLSGSKDRGVQFWDPNTGEAQLMLQGHKNSVISVAPSPRGSLFATGSGDQRARIWRYTPTHGY